MSKTWGQTGTQQGDGVSGGSPASSSRGRLSFAFTRASELCEGQQTLSGRERISVCLFLKSD